MNTDDFHGMPLSRQVVSLLPHCLRFGEPPKGTPLGALSQTLPIVPPPFSAKATPFEVKPRQEIKSSDLTMIPPVSGGGTTRFSAVVELRFGIISTWLLSWARNSNLSLGEAKAGMPAIRLASRSKPLLKGWGSATTANFPPVGGDADGRAKLAGEFRGWSQFHPGRPPSFGPRILRRTRPGWFRS